MPKKKLEIIPLGGLGEVGKNMMVIKVDRKMLVIDAGLMFPEEDMLGVDLVLPNFTYLKENRDQILGMVVTHGHEDHTGALPYLLREINIPVYATKLTLALIKNELENHNLDQVELKEIKAGDILELGPFKLEFIQVIHSIPDGVGIAIHTPLGLIIHTGDFKLDHTPVDGRKTDFAKFASYKNVLALLSDSTNAETNGYTQSEREVGRTLDSIFEQSKQRIIVASFASHIHRLQQILNTAERNGRKVAVAGINMENNIAVARELGYLKVPKEILISIFKTKSYPPNKVALLCTGSQGEPLSALSQIAFSNHKLIKLVPGDTVVISARPIPGNEKSVARIIDQLFKAGARVYYENISNVHVSGHAFREELKMMLELVRPKYFIPIHGEYRHLIYHAQIAKEVGMDNDHIIVAKNGDVIEFKDSQASIRRQISAGVTYVDGLGVGDIGNIVLRDRQLLSSDGVLIVVVTINSQNGMILAGPDIISRGFVYVKEAQEFLDEAKKHVQERLTLTAQKRITDWPILKSEVREVLSKFIYQKIKRHPMILPIIMEV